MIRTLNTAYLRPLLACYLVSAAISTLTIACYPKDCDPAKDPLQCRCPPGACGPYPSPPAPPPVRAGDAGTRDAH